jgi:hypothetical protein
VNNGQAKELLLLYRPGRAGQDEPEILEALERAKQDPELGQWFRDHCALQETIAAKFRQIEVPAGLKEQILSERKARAIPLPKRRVAALALSFAVGALLVGGIFVYSRPREDFSFANFRNRMTGLVSRQYPHMDLATNNLVEIRQFLARKGAPGDYVLPKSLEKVPSTGCAVLNWKGKTVSMVCFNSGTKGTSQDPDLFLFIIDRSGVAKPPATNSKQLVPVSLLATASWSSEGKAYLLAGAGDEDFLRAYLSN